VRYYEVDQQGVVFNGWYLSWFDEALSGFLRHQGLPVSVMEARDIDYMLVRSEIDWHAGVGYEDEVSIAVEPARIGNTSFDVRFSVLRDSKVTCSATIVYVSISRTGSGKQPVPELLRQALALSGPCLTVPSYSSAQVRRDRDYSKKILMLHITIHLFRWYCLE
jgi:acyl-CoA thioester hydrolase